MRMLRVVVLEEPTGRELATRWPPSPREGAGGRPLRRRWSSSPDLFVVGGRELDICCNTSGAGRSRELGEIGNSTLATADGASVQEMGRWCREPLMHLSLLLPSAVQVVG
jgi:hypothetical protein